MGEWSHEVESVVLAEASSQAHQPLPREPITKLSQCLPAPLVVWHHLAEGLPIVPSVSSMPHVDQLMDYDVINQRHRRLDDSPVEPEGAVAITTGPSLLLFHD